jgi:hypothetical protein
MNKIKTWSRFVISVCLTLLIGSCAPQPKQQDEKTSKTSAVTKNVVNQANPSALHAKPQLTTANLANLNPSQGKKPLLKQGNNPQKQHPNDSSARCTGMAVKSCIASDRCILSQRDNRAYFCRDVENVCEQGFVQQGNSSKKQCNNKASCVFTPEVCFCPPGVTCICGGGKPAACLLNETK